MDLTNLNGDWDLGQGPMANTFSYTITAPGLPTEVLHQNFLTLGKKNKGNKDYRTYLMVGSVIS